MSTQDIQNAYEDVFINNRLVSMQNAMDHMFAKLVEVFRYENLPLTIPQRVLETYTTRQGSCVVYKHEDELFVTKSLPSDLPDVYGENTRVHFTHTAGDKTEHLTRVIGVDAVLFRNDSNSIGLETIVTEFAIMEAQAKITLIRNLVDNRSHYIIQAKDQNAYESAVEYENAIRRGDTSVILAEEFGEMTGLAVHSTPISNSPATQTIELFQFIKSHYYGELGIDVNGNQKREYVNEAELQKSTGISLVINMLHERELAVRDINAIFGTDIKVGLSDLWNDEMEQDLAEPQSAGDDSSEPAGAGEDGTDLGPEDVPEDEPEAPEAPEPEGEDPAEDVEVDTVTAEELLEATEAMTGEDLHEEAATAAAGRDADTEGDSDPDDLEGSGVESEEDDDEDG